MRDLIAGELRGPSVFKDEKVLSFDFVPPELPGREEELKKLARVFRPLLAKAGGQHALVTGPVGSGKTALSRYFLREFQRIAKQDHGVALEFTDVNCRRRSTESAALLKILQHFDPRFPDRGFSMSEMLEILKKQLERREAHLVVILDEADILLAKSGSDLVYTLTRFNEESAGTGTANVGVSLVLVSQKNPRALLDEAAQSTLKATAIELDRYDAPGLAKIVRQRVTLAFRQGAFAEEIEELVADIAAEQGDARLAIELLQKSGQLADDEGKTAVEAEHVRGAKAEVNPFVDRGKLSELDAHKRLTLLAIARTLKRGGAFAITGDIEKTYAIACEEIGEKPRAHTQFWTYLKELETLGFIHAKRSGKGVLGTTTLVSLPDVPASVLEREILSLRTV